MAEARGVTMLCGVTMAAARDVANRDLRDVGVDAAERRGLPSCSDWLSWRPLAFVKVTFVPAAGRVIVLDIRPE